MDRSGEVNTIACWACDHLDLTDAKLGEEYSYTSITLCIIDAVWSLGSGYNQVQRVVSRYCETFGINRVVSPERIQSPSRAEQDSVSQLADRLESLGAEQSANKVFKNRQRTSTTNGILKADTIRRIAILFKGFGVEYLQDVSIIQAYPSIEKEFRRVPGQTEGKSFKYFLMLAGNEELIKADRMIEGRLTDILERHVSPQECEHLLPLVAYGLRARLPALTPRRLDYKIWKYESDRRRKAKEMRTSQCRVIAHH